jgi:uncharacterized protein (TIGR02996 family)
MTEGEAFLRAIADSPYDDTPRLVYADWLDEHGEQDRAEFIRVQVELARIDDDDPRHTLLKHRQDALLRRHRRAWKEHLPDWARPDHAVDDSFGFKGGVAVFRRGLPGHLNLTAKAFISHAEEFAQLAPLESATLCLESTQDVQALARCPALGRLTRLSFDGSHKLDAAELATLAASPHLGRLVSLALSDQPLGPRGMAALANLPRLTTLVAGNARLGERGLAALLNSALAERLTELRLPSNGLKATALRSLAAAGRPFPLACLELDNNPFGDDGAELLARAPLPRLARLFVGRCKIGPAGVAALGASRQFDNLATLDVSGNPLGPEGVRALAAAPHLGGLRCLQLGGCKVGLEGVEALAASPLLARLTSLALWRNALKDAGVQALAESPGLSGLLALGLGKNSIKDTGALALAAAALGRLLALDLDNNQVSAAGCLALVNSPNLGSLVRLSLYGNNISGLRRALPAAPVAPRGALALVNLGLSRMVEDSTVAALAGLPRMAGVTDLVLTSGRITPVGVRALANSPHLAGLTRLCLDWHRIGDDGVAALAESPHLHALEELNLHSTNITPAGVRLLVRAPWFGRLRRLDLGRNPIGLEGVRVLTACPGLAGLELLRLSSFVATGSDMGDEGAEALAACPYLTNLGELDVWYSGVGAAGRQALEKSPYLKNLSRLTI